MKKPIRKIAAGTGLLATMLTAQAGTISNDLVVHLKFEDTYADSSGNNNNGEAVGTPGFAEGKIGKALAFSSAADGSFFNYVTLGAPAALNFGASTDFSIAFWVKFSSWTGDPAFVSNKSWSSGGNQGYVIATDGDGRLQWNFKESGSGRKDYDGPAGTLSNGQWHHVVVTFDREGNATSYIDGVQVDSRSIAPGVETIDTPEGLATNIGQDGTGAYTDGGSVGIADGLIDDVGIWRRVVTGGEVSRIYAAAQSGVALGDVPDPATPVVTSVSVANGATDVSPSLVFSATIEDGTTAVVPSSVKLSLDGQVVTHALQTNGKTNVVTFDPPGIFASGSQHSFELIYGDSGTPQTLKTNAYSFTVRTYENRTLPAPLFLENFDAVAQGELPAGWTVKNYTDPGTAGVDFLDPTSDAYLNWVVISRATVLAADWDAPRRLNVAPGQVVNGEEITSLVVNNYIYGESDNRGGNQVQILTSPDFNLTGKENIVLSYYSSYEQNQDSIGLVEYSVDEGATWNPVVYMIDQADIIRTEGGEVDAVATLSEVRADQPYYFDAETNETGDGSYGSFAKTPITQALAPYISGRINDNAVESKRVEIFPMPQAANQAKVRLRFVHAGTGSWYWGLDNIGLYSLGATVAPPTIDTQPVSVSGSELSDVTLSVSASGTPPLTYQWQKNEQNIANATGATLTLRRLTAADAGSYRVIVSNAAGPTTSAPATVTVTPVAASVVTGQWDFNQGDLRATIGSPLEYRGDTAAGTTFSAVPISGTDAAVMGFPATSPTQGYVMPHGAAPNGGGSFVNQYTLIMDVMFPASSDSAWRALLQTSPSNANDGDLFVNTANGIGISGQYQGTILADTWHRIAFVFDLPNSRVAKYVDGTLVNVQTLGSGRDGRWSLADTALLFADEDSETAAGFVNSIQFRSGLMTDAQIAALGGASAAGIPGGEAPIRLGIVRSGTNVIITISGEGTMQLQKKASLSDTTWQDVGAPTTEKSITVPATDAAGFFRVLKQ